MDWDDPIAIILLVAVTVTLSSLCMVSIVDGRIIELQQVSPYDIAYLGETVDTSLVVAWPLYQLAWCNDENPGCGGPLIFDLGDENQHRVYLDPAIYKLGSYYRWDGGWNRGENSYAFTIRRGTRPLNETVVEIGGITTTADKVTMPAESLPNSTHIVVARGDGLSYQYAIPNTTSYQNGYLWLFGESRDGIIGSQILGEPMRFRSNDSVYSYEFEYLDTEKYIEGLYTGYLQFSGGNRLQDVFYLKDHKIRDREGIEHYSVLDTPYDDDVIPDVVLDGFIPVRIQKEFEKLEQNRNTSLYCDDILIPITADMKPPTMAFTEYYEDGDNLIVSGTTTASPGTVIKIQLDPDNYKLKADIAAHTWSAAVVGKTDGLRTFNITIPVLWDEMAIGEHEVYGLIEKNRYKTDTTLLFKVSDIYVMPTPTPARERVVVEEYGWHRILPNVTAAAPAPLATLQYVNMSPEAVVTTIISTATNESYILVSNETIIVPKAEPTTNQTTVVPTPIPTTRDPNITIPLPLWLGIAAVCIAIWRRK